MSFLKSRLRWLWHISLLLLRESRKIFLTLSQTKQKFLYDAYVFPTFLRKSLLLLFQLHLH